MDARLFRHPLFLRSMGWTTQGYAPAVRESSDWSELSRSIVFAGAPHAVIPAAPDDQLAPLVRPYLKASGVSRARSAAKSTVFAATLGKALAATLAGQPTSRHDPGDRVSIGTVSSTAIIPIFWAYESVGLTEGWLNTDTLLFPASIPTAVVTAVSNVTDYHAAASFFGDGAGGMFAAVEHAYLDFFHDRADFAMIIGAEEASEPMVKVLIHFQIWAISGRVHVEI